MTTPIPHVATRPMLIAALFTLLSGHAVALEQSTAPAKCDSPQHHELDFWVGDWQVFDAESNALVAFDHVEKQ